MLRSREVGLGLFRKGYVTLYSCSYMHINSNFLNAHRDECTSAVQPELVKQIMSYEESANFFANLAYRISSYSFRGNYSFLNLTLCTVTFGNSTYRCGNYSREETIQGRKLYEEIRQANSRVSTDLILYMTIALRIRT